MFGRRWLHASRPRLIWLLYDHARRKARRCEAAGETADAQFWTARAEGWNEKLARLRRPARTSSERMAAMIEGLRALAEDRDRRTTATTAAKAQG